MDAGHKETDKLLEKLEKRIKQEYKKASKEVNDKLKEYLKQFEKADAAHKQMVNEGRITEREYQTWRQSKIATGKRWEQMRDTLLEDYSNANRIARSMLGEHLKDVYAINHNYGTYEVEKGAKMSTSYTLYDHPTVERLLRDNPKLIPDPGKKAAQKIAEGKLKAWNKKKIQSVLVQSILQGESIPKIADRVSRTVGEIDSNAAIRTARTMTTGAECAGRVDSYKRAENLGINMEQVWIATLDGRTRHEHRLLDGQKSKVGKPFKVEGEEIMYPGDPTAKPHLVYNCRCTIIAAVEGSNVLDATSKLHEEANIDGMSYEEWKDAKRKEKSNADNFVLSEAELQKEREANKRIEDEIRRLDDAWKKTYERESEIDSEISNIDKERKILEKDYSMFDEFSNKIEYFKYRDGLNEQIDSLWQEREALKRPRSSNFDSESEYDKAFEEYLKRKIELQENIEATEKIYYNLVNNYPGNWDYIEQQRKLKNSLNSDSFDDRINKLKEEREQLLKDRERYFDEKYEAMNKIAYNSAKLLDKAKLKGVFYDRPAAYAKMPSFDEIVSRLAGGDLTEGSCASLGFCYIGQKNGYNVLDFRDGESRELMSFDCKSIVRGISKETNGKLFTAETKTGTGGAIKLTKQMEPGKEYYVVTGRHAAIMRNNNNQIEYLELQSGRENGWKFMGMNGDRKQLDSMFRWRFGNSSSISGEAIMMDINDMKDSKLLHMAYGYMNTAESAQHKGRTGHER